MADELTREECIAIIREMKTRFEDELRLLYEKKTDNDAKILELQKEAADLELRIADLDFQITTHRHTFKEPVADWLDCRACGGTGFVERRHDIGKMHCVSCGGDGLVWREVWGTEDRQNHMSGVAKAYHANRRR